MNEILKRKTQEPDILGDALQTGFGHKEVVSFWYLFSFRVMSH
jgi:hypothetical protein